MNLVQISPFSYGLLAQLFNVSHVDFGTAHDSVCARQLQVFREEQHKSRDVEMNSPEMWNFSRRNESIV